MIAGRGSDKIGGVSPRSTGVAWLVVVVSAAGVGLLGVLGGVHAIPILAGVALAALAVASIVVAHRYFAALSFLGWIVPFVPLCLFFVVFEQSIRAGIISIGSILFACLLALALASTFLIVARERIRKCARGDDAF
jgi:hypothetical protein